MDYVERFSDADLAQITNEALIYMCACPAQVAEALRKVRELYRYQLNCMQEPESVSLVHQTIAAAAIATHEELQSCMEKILELEQWDRTTLRMPDGLRRRQVLEIQKDS